MFRNCLTGRPYLWATRERQLSPSVLTLCILVMCKAHASFRRMLSHKLPAKNLQSSIFLSLHTQTHTLSLFHTQPLQLNLTINTGYKRLNKITIKFGMKLKPTKQIVVNYVILHEKDPIGSQLLCHKRIHLPSPTSNFMDFLASLLSFRIAHQLHIQS